MKGQEKFPIEIPDAEYALFDTEREDLPAVVVVNKSLMQFHFKEVFPWYLSIVIEGEELAQGRMPTRSESEILTKLGDRLEDAVLATQTEHGSTNALLIAHLTWNGQRQQIYYAHDPKPLDHMLRCMLQEEAPEREWEYVMECDQEWQFAAPFLRLCTIPHISSQG